MPFAIHHDRVAHRFDTAVDGMHCELDYTLVAGVLTITHTGVPAEVGGRGIASALVQAAMDVARAEGWKVVPACSYATTWITRHPEYQDCAGETPAMIAASPAVAPGLPEVP